jgi:hypothetical protein
MKVTAKPHFIDGDVPKETPARKDKPVCKNCRVFKNKPGYCSLKNKFTRRKATCEEFRR